MCYLGNAHLMSRKVEGAWVRIISGEKSMKWGGEEAANLEGQIMQKSDGSSTELVRWHWSFNFDEPALCSAASGHI